jgi:hypothetical protein
MNARLEANLLRLSLVRVGHRRVPSPPNNTERLRAYRNATDPVIGNGVDFRQLAEQVRAHRYAREQAADGPCEVIEYADRRGF